MGRLEASEMVEWAQRSVSLAVPDQPESADAAAMLGIGLGFLGRADEGLAAQRTRLSAATSTTGPGSDGLALRMAHGWLHLATDDIPSALSELSAAAPAALQAGSYRVALYSFTWLARSHFSSGDWDEAVVDADRALDHGLELEAGPARPAISQAQFVYVFEPGGNRIELVGVAGYDVTDPSWEPVTWVPHGNRPKRSSW